MKYYILKPHIFENFGPETVMEAGMYPSVVKKPHCVFGEWPDEIVASHPAYAVAEILKNKIEELGATGVVFHECLVSKGDQYEIASPEHPQKLPAYYQLCPTGKAGLDDFGISDDLDLVVSEKIVGLLKSRNLFDCLIEDYPS